MFRPSLLLLTAGAAGLAVVANAASIAAPDGQQAPKTRLGNSIEQDISERDAAAARRKRGLDLREQAAKAAEARLQASVSAQQPAAATPANGAAPAEAADAQFDDLARIYQAMKPKAAAVVFEQLDMEVQMKVAQRMRDRSTAMIMAAMTPKAAAALSMALARRNSSRPQVAAAAPPAGAPRKAK
ncbi:magnesium transporter MgtE N-terminal domain-containing protein [Sphingomonas sp. MMS12-HWE2-04]|uniref:magnesium transporter MgtE N-terminal domain-containing protein n=1 Tax=Sphingomonas sp. MMS12-HWE2-04 TaxID=3234199 RepID=UPI00384AA1FD